MAVSISTASSIMDGQKNKRRNDGASRADRLDTVPSFRFSRFQAEVMGSVYGARAACGSSYAVTTAGRELSRLIIANFLGDTVFWVDEWTGWAYSFV